MSEPTIEEMVGHLEWMSCPRDECPTCKAIRSLIENSDKGPEVDEKFIHRWCCRLGELLPSDAAYQIRMMLREAGVRVREEK